MKILKGGSGVERMNIPKLKLYLVRDSTYGNIWGIYSNKDKAYLGLKAAREYTSGPNHSEHWIIDPDWSVEL